MTRKSLSRLVVGFLAVTVLGIASSASATGIDTNSANLPPAGVYLSPTDVHAMYSGPGLAIVLKAVQHKPFTDPNSPVFQGPTRHDDGSGNEIEDFNSDLNAMVNINSGPFQPVVMSGPVEVKSYGKTGNPTGTFTTEMLTLNLTGGGGLMIRESPTLQSLGQTTITPIGGGMFHIDSFFDVFTELSLDGGQSWMPSQGSTHVDLAPLPEPGSLTLLGVAGVGLMARRRRSAV